MSFSIFKKKKEVTLPTYDNKPNENMFDDLNLKRKKKNEI